MRFIKWLRTDVGRTFSLSCVTATGACLVGWNFLPDTFFLNKYMEIVQAYRHGFPVPVSARVLQQIEAVMNDMSIPPQEQKLIKPFTVVGFDTFHAGCTYANFGALIGIPTNFSYSDENDVDRNITINNSMVPWHKTAAQNLKSALVLSENAQKFAIGHEIAMVQTPLVYLKTIQSSFVVIFTYKLARFYNNKFVLFSKPLIVRVIMYLLCGLFGVGLWALLKDYSTVYYENVAEHTLCSLGKEYIDGGIEFYTKLLQKNKLVRELMGSAGEKLYTASGNEYYFLRNKHLPIVTRKEFLETQLQTSRDINSTTGVQDKEKVAKSA